MKLVFVSNYFTHHQKPLCDALSEICDFTFIATESMDAERKSLGWESERPGYLLEAGDGSRAAELLDAADAVIAGSAPERLLRPAIRSGKPVFRYSERPLKNGSEPLKYLPRLIRWNFRNPPGKPVYLLCASAYAYGDYSKFGLFRNRAYRWGYFPELRRYDSLPADKNSRRILWCGRFLGWKHPESALEAARRLRDEGLEFELELIGTGELEGRLRELIAQYSLGDWVRLLPPMKPDGVRSHMEKAGIYLFTSDRREGWGAVLNEAMNSCCAVISSREPGSAPYLIEDGKNGLFYSSPEELYSKIRRLLESPDEQLRLGAAAYETIAGEWNAEVAAERFVRLAEAVLAGERFPEVSDRGVCSRIKRGERIFGEVGR